MHTIFVLKIPSNLEVHPIEVDGASHFYHLTWEKVQNQCDTMHILTQIPFCDSMVHFIQLAIMGFSLLERPLQFVIQLLLVLL